MSKSKLPAVLALIASLIMLSRVALQSNRGQPISYLTLIAGLLFAAVALLKWRRPDVGTTP
jgi:hypothetical protein